MLFAALGKRASVSIYGSDYPTPDGTCLRDYVHVADLAEAHVLALRYLEQDNPSARFNLGTGRGASVKEVIAVARKVTGRPIEVVMAPRRAGDPPALVADARRATEALGWTPRYADLASQIGHAWQWLERASRQGPAAA